MLKKYFLSDEIVCTTPCVFLLGGFDGIHKGHKKLIDRAKELDLPIGIMTIRGGKNGNSLFTLAEREKIFASLGVSLCLEAEFSEEFKNTTAEGFVKMILQKFPVRAFVCGKDFRFGKNAQGDPDVLRKISSLPVYAEDISVDDEGKKIGTTAIKGALQRGDLAEVNQTLAVPFFVSGEVLHGRHVGSSLGFPTANVVYPQEKAQIEEAVYAVRVPLEGKVYRGIANYGRCPTFDVEYKLLETYIDGFQGDLYGKTIDVIFDFKIRDIRKFSSKDDLITQLNQDIETIRG